LQQKILYNQGRITRKPIYFSNAAAILVSTTEFSGRKPAMDIIKVSGRSRTAAVAGAIAGVIRENQRAEVQAIGASAINQAVKAMALAKSYLIEDGYNIVFIPEFVDVEIDEKIRTAIKFVVEPR
jgi:stage V sporulation protein S